MKPISIEAKNRIKFVFMLLNIFSLIVGLIFTGFLIYFYFYTHQMVDAAMSGVSALIAFHISDRLNELR